MIKKSVINKKLFWVALLLLLTTLLVIIFIYQNKQSSNIAPPPNNDPNAEKLDLSPATKEDQARADANKERIVSQQEQQPSQPVSGKKSVNPVIADANQYGSEVEVRSFVPGIVESDGICTITLSQGTTVITKEVAAVQDATTTQCTKLKLARSEFSSNGTVTVVVTYSSAKSSGSSEPRTMELNQ